MVSTVTKVIERHYITDLNNLDADVVRVFYVPIVLYSYRRRRDTCNHNNVYQIGKSVCAVRKSQSVLLINQEHLVAMIE